MLKSLFAKKQKSEPEKNKQQRDRIAQLSRALYLAAREAKLTAAEHEEIERIATELGEILRNGHL